MLWARWLGSSAGDRAGRSAADVSPIIIDGRPKALINLETEFVMDADYDR